MKYQINEMMEHLDEQYLNQLSKEEYALDELEVKRICKMVKKKRYKKPVIRVNKLKRLAIIIAVICAMCTVVYAVNKMSILEILFNENANNLSESGKKIGIDDEHQQIKVTLQGVIGYERVLSLIYDVEKIDNIEFKGDQLKFYSYVEIEDKGQVTRYIINDNREIISERTPTKRTYVATISNYFENLEYLRDESGNIETIEFANVDSFSGKRMKFITEEIVERYRSKDKPDLDLVAYLKEHPYVKTQPLTEQNTLIYWGDEKEFNTPTKILGNEKLNLILYNKLPQVTISNIGFIDGKLHLRTQNMMAMWERGYELKMDGPIVRWYNGTIMDGNLRVRLTRKKNVDRYKNELNESYVLEIRDKEGNWIDPEYANYNAFNKEKGIEKYEVYNIKDVEELSQYDITAHIKVDEKVTQDRWEIPFEADTKSECKRVNYKEEIMNEPTKDKWNIDKIDLANVYVSIQLTCKKPNREDPVIPAPIKLIMKDQTEITLLESWDYDYKNRKELPRDLKEGYVYESHRGNTANIDGFFIKAIDVNEVKSIQIGEENIPIN